MFKREVDGSEIEFVLEERAYAEIDERAPVLMEWLSDRHERMAQIIARLWRKPGVYHDLEAGMLLSMLRNDYISQRKYQADALEHEEIADQLREPSHEY